MGNAEIEMPKYKCHKEVWALKIKDIVPQTQEDLVESDGPKPDGATLYPENTTYSSIFVDQAYIDKHHPEIGGYYVVYTDGYKSFSPADAFESGYSLSS